MFEYVDGVPGEMWVGSVAVSWGFSFTQVSAVFGLSGLATAGHLFSSLISDPRF